MSALDEQEGGAHYKGCAIQPVQYIHANGLGYCEGAVIKYVTRYKSKNGAEDLRKAIHFLQLLLELEYPENTEPPKATVGADNCASYSFEDGKCTIFGKHFDCYNCRSFSKAPSPHLPTGI